MRIAHWLSVSSCVLVATLVACSSSKTGGGKMNTGGSGALIDDEGEGGEGSTSSGAGGNPGRAGSTSGGGLTGSGGGCAGTPVTCVDEATAQFCNPDTNALETLVCSEAWAEDGFVSNGCAPSLEGAGCTTDGVADTECANGAVVFGVCGSLTGEEQVNVYVNCFHDNEGARELVTCLGTYVDEAAMTVDCVGAETCFPPEPEPEPAP